MEGTPWLIRWLIKSFYAILKVKTDGLAITPPISFVGRLKPLQEVFRYTETHNVVFIKIPRLLEVVSSFFENQKNILRRVVLMGNINLNES